MAIPLVHEMKPLPWQREFAREALRPGKWDGVDPAKSIRLLAIAGGRGSGKSVTLCWVACLLAMTRPGITIGLLMDTYPRLRDVHLPILNKMATALGGVRTDNDFRFPSGSIIKMRYLDMAGSPLDGKSPIEGWEVHVLIADECQTVDSDYWTIFCTRARVSAVDANGNTCIPLVITCGVPQSTWWCAATKEQGGKVWRPRTGDNTYLPPGTEARLRAQMTEAMARSYLDGEELIQQGSIFDAYRETPYPDGSLVTYHPNLATCRTILAADLGIRSPHALLMMEDPTKGAWVVTHEWAPDDVSIGDLCRMIRKDACPRREWVPGGKMLPIDKFVVDPAGSQRSDHDGRSGLDIFALPPPEGMGMYPITEKDPSRRDVGEGILRLQLALERRKLLFSQTLIEKGKATPKDQRSIAKTMLGYRWDPKNPARPHKDGFFDHGADALRYGFREVAWNVNPVPNLYTGTVPAKDRGVDKSLSTISDALAQARDQR